MSHIENRQHPRFPLRMPVLWESPAVRGYQKIGFTQNVSQGGLLLALPFVGDLLTLYSFDRRKMYSSLDPRGEVRAPAGVTNAGPSAILCPGPFGQEERRDHPGGLDGSQGQGAPRLPPAAPAVLPRPLSAPDRTVARPGPGAPGDPDLPGPADLIAEQYHQAWRCKSTYGIFVASSHKMYLCGNLEKCPENKQTMR